MLEKNLWQEILDATVEDFYADEVKNKGRDKVFSKPEIKSKILNACPENQVNSEENQIFLSAKEIAEYRFLMENIKPRHWWTVVCSSINVVYDREIGQIQPTSVGKTPKTKRQKELWQKILDATVKDFYMDEAKRKEGDIFSKQEIKNKILNACSK